MFQKAAAINNAQHPSKKCVHCGLRNFADCSHCQRCKSDLSVPLQEVAKSDKQMRPASGELNRSTFRFAWILAASVLVPVLLIFFFVRQGPQRTPEVRDEAVVAPTPVTPTAERPAQNAVEQDSQSEAAATQIVTDLKRFQDAAESGLDYNEYDRNLNQLKSGLDHTLPSFARQNPKDEIFRQEVAGALRDYTAAGNWWKTTIMNSTVFTEADRNERTQKSFESARTHLTNAEKTLHR